MCMFEKKEFTRVDRDYFKVITETACHLTIKSKITLNDRVLNLLQQNVFFVCFFC